MITLAYIASAFAVIIVVGTLSAWAYDTLEARLAAHRPARDRRGVRSGTRGHGLQGNVLHGHPLRNRVDRGLRRARHGHGSGRRDAVRAVRTVGTARVVPMTLAANGRALRRS